MGKTVTIFVELEFYYIWIEWILIVFVMSIGAKHFILLEDTLYWLFYVVI